MKNKIDDLTNEEIRHIIELCVHSERDREILSLRLTDGLTYEQIAEHVGMSVRQISRIVPKLQDKLYKHL